MASIQKTAKGYRAQIKLARVRNSDTFPARREAVEWAAKREAGIRDHATKPAGDLHTLRQALRKYSDEVSPHRKGERWEQVCLAAFESYKQATSCSWTCRCPRLPPSTSRRSGTIAPRA